MKDKKTKALVLMSGGLDSMLAARTFLDQGIQVTGLVFIKYFFGAAKARKAAGQLGIELKEVDFKEEHLDMVKNPKHGYGKNMNPCIDCHALMLKHAKKIMEDEKYDFVATGEVLGQRPMSQNKGSLDIVNRESGLGDLLVRPMSAKLLEESRPEKEGKVIRGRLHRISGRSRDVQKELVKKYGIKEYASPGGGCLLTDPGFSERLIKLFDYWPENKGADIDILKFGRVQWINNKNGKVVVVIGRKKEECEELEKMAQSKDVLIDLKDEVGPMTLIRGLNINEIKLDYVQADVPKILKMSELKLGDEKTDDDIINIAGLLTGYHAPKSRGKKVKLNIRPIG